MYLQRTNKRQQCTAIIILTLIEHSLCISTDRAIERIQIASVVARRCKASPQVASQGQSASSESLADVLTTNSIFIIFYFITIQSSRIIQLTQVCAFVTKQPVLEGAASSDVHFFENPVNICSKITNVWDARSFQMIAIEMASSSVTLIHFYFKLQNNSKRLRKRDHLNGFRRVLKSNNCRRQKRFT